MAGPLPADDTRHRLTAALPELGGAAWRPSTGLACRVLPAWVGAHGHARTENAWWILLAPGEAVLPQGMDQAVCEVAPGRYVVDVYDTARGAWISRESALAPPLVVGVPRCQGAVILRITANHTPSKSP